MLTDRADHCLVLMAHSSRTTSAELVLRVPDGHYGGTFGVVGRVRETRGLEIRAVGRESRTGSACGGLVC